MPNYCEKSCVMSICAAIFTAAPVEPYVDDLTTVEAELSRGAQVAGATGWEAWPYSAEARLWTMASLMTSPLAREKRIGWTSTPASCGVQTDLDELSSIGEVRLRIKESTREKVRQLVATILEESHFGAGIQAHLTGKLGYVLLDKAGRAALQPLVDHVCDDGRIDLDQSMALSFIQKLLGGELPDKTMYSLQRKPPVRTVFSDASEEPPQPPSIWPVGRLAFIVFKPNGETVYAETLAQQRYSS